MRADGVLRTCGIELARAVNRDRDGAVVGETVTGVIGADGTRLFATLNRELPDSTWFGQATLMRDGFPDRCVAGARFYTGHAAAAVAWTGLLRTIVYDWRRKSPGRRRA